MRQNSYWNILWIFVHLLSMVATNGGHQVELCSHILMVFTKSSSVLIYWWCSPSTALFSYIGGVHQVQLCSHILVVFTKYSSALIYWWCSPSPALFSYIGGVHQVQLCSHILVVSTKSSSVLIYWWCSPRTALFSYIGWIQKSLNESEQFSLFDKLSVNNVFRVVYIHAILI